MTRPRPVDGGLRGPHDLATTSLPCAACGRAFFFARHRGRVWRTRCPDQACREVVVVSRDRAFRRRVERPGDYLRRSSPRPPLTGLLRHSEIAAVAAAWGAALAPAVWGIAVWDPPGGFGIATAILVGVVVLALATTVVLATRRRLEHRERRDESLRDHARALGRSPLVTTLAQPGWFGDTAWEPDAAAE